MAKKESSPHETELSSAFNLIPTELAAMGKKRIENFANAQAEFLDNVELVDWPA
jgi:hypothetical protein